MLVLFVYQCGGSTLIIGIEKDQARFKVNDPEVQREARMKKLQHVIAKMDMGYLTTDKDFLDEIVSHPEIVASPNKISTAELLALASTCHRNAMHLQELLRMRRPLYILLFQRRKIPKGHKMMIERERKLRRNLIIVEADFLLHRMHVARINKDYPTFFKSVEASDELSIYYAIFRMFLLVGIGTHNKVLIIKLIKMALKI